MRSIQHCKHQLASAQGRRAKHKAQIALYGQLNSSIHGYACFGANACNGNSFVCGTCGFINIKCCYWGMQKIVSTGYNGINGVTPTPPNQYSVYNMPTPFISAAR